MARQESDREDIMREATALVERIEMEVARLADPVIVGFRRDGCGSVFWGQDPVYQFNSLGCFRRGYCNGVLIKAERGRLVSLERRRAGGQVELVRRELDGGAAAGLIASVAEHLGQLRRSVAQADYRVVRQVPDGPEMIGRVENWLDLVQPIKIAASPHAR